MAILILTSLLVASFVVSGVTKSILTGDYSGEDQDGLYYMLKVELKNNQLELAYRPGGASTFTYREKEIIEVIPGKEFLLKTEDIDHNGTLDFLYKRSDSKSKFTIEISDPTDSSFPKIQLSPTPDE